jgi:hypothetical protein
MKPLARGMVAEREWEQSAVEKLTHQTEPQNQQGPVGVGSAVAVKTSELEAGDQQRLAGNDPRREGAEEQTFE